ncbi:MAG: hypothetical protein ACM3ZU_13990 [Bacteroidota bacterium]
MGIVSNFGWVTNTAMVPLIEPPLDLMQLTNFLEKRTDLLRWIVSAFDLDLIGFGASPQEVAIHCSDYTKPT